MKWLYRVLLLGALLIVAGAVILGATTLHPAWGGLLVGLLAGGIVVVLVGGVLSVIAALIGEIRTIASRIRDRSDL